MRIIAVSDTHMFQEVFKELPSGDLFIHAGDLLREGTLKELSIAVEWLKSLPYKYKISVAGNHERCFENNLRKSKELLSENIIYLQDSGVEIDGLNIWGSPWQPEFNNWAFNLPRGPLLAEKWKLIPEKTDILITHCPPFGIGDDSEFPEKAGCRDLYKRIKKLKPKLHIFGHIHNKRGCCKKGATSFINATTDEALFGPVIIDFDLNKKKVERVEFFRELKL